ncbi:hypothetical protein Ahy_B08g088993 isoform B [Arachis hypogaea]|uniref:Uncharacterized protein n=1 Tax=Arachis hypogaea TaxID=3818 RepID=A0A444XWD4_ARAHY|nr:hypothetical protein Ahy_B08g088993 isoform B [Arachis hypogaea]
MNTTTHKGKYKRDIPICACHRQVHFVCFIYEFHYFVFTMLDLLPRTISWLTQAKWPCVFEEENQTVQVFPWKPNPQIEDMLRLPQVSREKRLHRHSGE